VPSLRSWASRAARWLDILAVVVVLVAIARFVVLPRLGHDVVQAPPVSLATLDGGRYDLQQRRGRLVFLDFWASWCDPCRQSIPLVQHFARTHPGVDVISVDSGEVAALVRPFAEHFRMNDVALDPDMTVSRAFGVTGYPTLFAIDGTGRVVGRWIGYDPDIEREMSATVARVAPRKTASL
jgi:thiol-disulfide isomerase/thioredoxin